MTATVFDFGPTVAMLTGTGPGSVDLEVRRTSDGALVNSPIRFIAIGPR